MKSVSSKIVSRFPAMNFSGLLFLLVACFFLVNALQVSNFFSTSAETKPQSLRADGSKIDPMDVVLIVDMSKINKVTGIDMAEGFRNSIAAHGLSDVVRMVIRDDESRPEAAAALADGSAAGNRTLAMVGPSEPESVLAIDTSAKEGEVVAILPIGIPGNQKNSQFSFSLQAPTLKKGQVLGSFMRRITPGKRVARFILPNAKPDGLWAGLTSSFSDIGSEGLELVTWIPNQSTEKAQVFAANNSAFDAIVLSLPLAEAETAVRALKNIRYGGRIILDGESTLGTFPQRFSHDKFESLKTGFYTDDIIALVPFLPTVASETSQKLIAAYKTAHGTDPSWAYAYGYDAGLLIADFVLNATKNNTFNLNNPDKMRNDLRKFLSDIQTQPEQPIGLTGKLKFDGNRQRALPPKLVIYRNKVQMPFFEQLADEPSLSSDFLTDTESVSIGDESYRLVPVVYTGLSVKQIETVDFDTGRCRLTFVLSLKSRQPIDINDIMFFNQIGDFQNVKQVEEIKTDDAVLRRYQITGLFSFQPQPADVILDRTTISLKWRHRRRDNKSIRFVIDPDFPASVSHNTNKVGQANDETHSDGFGLKDARYGVDDESIAAPGDPRSVDGLLKYSVATYQADLSREVSSVTSSLINLLGVSLIHWSYLIFSMIFAACCLVAMIFVRPATAILRWTCLLVTTFLCEAAFFTSVNIVYLPTSSLVTSRYGFAFLFSLSIARIVDIIFISMIRNHSKTNDVQPVLMFLMRFGVYFAGIGFFYTVILGRDLLPLLATFSVLLTVLGLALRELIFDAISGIALASDGQLMTGQWVNLRTRDRSIHGMVLRLEWRNVAIRSRDEQIHFVPYSAVATQVLSNLSMSNGFSRTEISFIMSAEVPLDQVKPDLMKAIGTSLAHMQAVDHSRPFKIIVAAIEDERMRCVVQVFYSPKESVDTLRTIVLETVQVTLVAHNALARFHETGNTLAQA